MERKSLRRHVTAIGLALSLGVALILGIIVGLDSLRLPRVQAVSTAVPASRNVRSLVATGGLTGWVQAEGSGAPLAGVSVSVYDGVSFARLYTTTTDANGQYLVTLDSPYGQARVFFNGSLVGYSQEWYGDEPFFSEADRVNLQEGGVVTDVNAVLAERGRISGTITLDVGTPATDVCVTIVEANAGCNAHTDQEGQFVVTDLMSGTYHLVFSGGAFPGILTEWYRDKVSSDTADPVAVPGGAVTAITAQVASRNVITGMVTDEYSGLPIDNAEVVLYDEHDQVVRDMRTPCWTCGPGEYRFYATSPGGYRLGFSHLPYHVTEFYNDQQLLSDATVVSITAGQVITNVNAALTTGLTGTLVVALTQGNYQPLSSTHSAYVELDDNVGNYLATVGSINGNGSTISYTFVVSGGDYLVYLGANYPLIGEWYNDQPVSATAELVTITPGATTTISADLAVATTYAAFGCITGTVTSGGAPLQGAQARVYRVGQDQLALDNHLETDAAGVYGPVCVQPGDYVVGFSRYPFATTWYSNTMARATADTVTVTSDVTLADVNGALGDVGGCISGRIVDSNSLPAASAQFLVRDSGGNQAPIWQGLYGSTLRDEGDADVDGGFVACGLASGTYKVQCPTVKGSASVRVAAPWETGGVICKSHAIYLPIIMRDPS